MTRLAIVGAAAVAVALGGCGAATEDLMAIERSFPETGVHVRLRVTNDGRGSCGAGPLRPLPSQTLLDARGVKRALRPLAKRGATLNGARDDRSSYVFRSFDGVVRWTEGAGGPPALARAALFELRLERLLCRE